MRLNGEYVLRQIADSWVVLPLGSPEVNFDGMLALNESGAFLWKLLEAMNGREEMAKAMAVEYGITLENAVVDVDEFLIILRQFGCIEDN